MLLTTPHLFLLLLPLLLPTPCAASYNWDITTHGLVSGWRWEKPWPHDDSPLMQFVERCRAAGTFAARQYTLGELEGGGDDGAARRYAGAARALASGRVYPGSWDGVNVKGDRRALLLVDWPAVPAPARAWVEARLADDEGRRRHFFAVVARAGAVASSPSDPDRPLESIPPEDRVLIIAPGELYQFLPLWVAEGSDCADTLKDLSKYVASHPKGECVVAWPTDHSRRLLEEGAHNITFTVEARVVEETAEGRAARLFWERHHEEMKRVQRKVNREERAASRKNVEKDREASTAHDEL